MIRFRANHQFLAMRGERLARLAPAYLDGAPATTCRPATAGAGAVLPPVPLAAGKQAALEESSASGAADLSDKVRMVVRLVSEAEQISDGEGISRAVCRYAERHVGLPSLLGDNGPDNGARHANRRDAALHGLLTPDGDLTDLPDFPRTAFNRMGATAR